MNAMDLYDYPLDPDRIAQHPPDVRDGAKMLVVDRSTGAWRHACFTDFPKFLTPKDLVILNDTRVLPARLFGHRPEKEESIEVLLLKRLPDARWETLVRPGKKMRPGAEVVFGDGRLRAVVEDIAEDGKRIVRFSYEGIWEEILESLGEMPLPPYIHERLEDPSRYQTVYAKHDGSAAAPTAGLHFTDDTFRALEDRNIPIAYVTLHVGLGTFRPVSAERIEDHIMHSEWYHLPKETVEAMHAARQRGGRIVAIGTTTTRVLESIGSAVWEEPREYSGDTKLFIQPGFSFAVVDAMLTNFHLPKSTLLMLVSAFSGRENILNAYKEAQEQDYRFFSFGDCMLLTEGIDEIHTP